LIINSLSFGNFTLNFQVRVGSLYRLEVDYVKLSQGVSYFCYYFNSWCKINGLDSNYELIYFQYPFLCVIKGDYIFFTSFVFLKEVILLYPRELLVGGYYVPGCPFFQEEVEISLKVRGIDYFYNLLLEDKIIISCIRFEYNGKEVIPYFKY
jgi:hypothetical protein